MRWILHINWYIEESLLSTTMIEPVYILENGQNVPYVPMEIKDHREAYAATLHVLFKHVADFHICVVKTFSKKYGIPEDDIMQTIQESDEFKNMWVDPVLHHDGLGYLSPQPQPQQQQQEPAKQQQPQEPAKQQQPQEPAKQQQQEPAKKRIVKKKSPTNPVPVAVVPDPVPAAAVVPEPVPAAAVVPDPVPVAVVEKRKVIRKKVPPPPVALDLTTERNDPLRPDVLVPPPPITQKKIIRKKS